MASLGGTPNDYWWLKPSQPDNPLPAMALGARMKQDAIDNALNVQRLKLAEQAQTDAALARFEHNSLLQEQNDIRLQEQVAKTKLQNNLMQGSSELAQMLSGIEDWSDPSVRTKMLEFATKNPALAQTPIWKEAGRMHEFAGTAKRQLEADRRLALSQQIREQELDEQRRGNDLKEQKLATEISPMDKMKLTDELSALKERTKSGEFLDETIKDASAQKHAESLKVQIERAKIFNKYKQPTATPQTDAAPSVPAGPAPAAEPAASPESIRESFKAGKLTKEQAVEQLKALGFK